MSAWTRSRREPGGSSGLCAGVGVGEKVREVWVMGMTDHMTLMDTCKDFVLREVT